MTENTHPLVSIITVNWNGRHLLERCLHSLKTQTYASFDIVVVDNGSSDGSVEWVEANYPAATIIRNDRNLGFAVALNQGIQASDAPYVVTLNNDTEVVPGWLETLIQAAESAPDVGMCASHILFDDRRHIVDSMGIKVDWSGTAWNQGHGHPEPGNREEPIPVWGASAAAALYRRAMLDDIGLFDEDFFAYYEDVDLAWRAQSAGWRCLYVPAAIVYHVHSATAGRNPRFKQYHISRNKLWTLVKNYRAPQLWIALPLMLAADSVALLIRWFRSPDLGWAATRGRWDAWRGLGSFMTKRRRLESAASQEFDAK